jgi:nicotinamide mononucleotide (NMN) deamidase PncC
MDGGTLDNPVGLVHFAATLRGGQLIAFAAKPALSTQKYL